MGPVFPGLKWSHVRGKRHPRAPGVTPHYLIWPRLGQRASELAPNEHKRAGQNGAAVERQPSHDTGADDRDPTTMDLRFGIAPKVGEPLAVNVPAGPYRVLRMRAQVVRVEDQVVHRDDLVLL